MIRARNYPELKRLRIDKLPQCCKDAGNKQCRQHKQASKQQMGYRHSQAEQAIISDLIDVWGHVAMFNNRGWQIDRIDAEY